MPRHDGKPTPDILALRRFFRDAMSVLLGHRSHDDMVARAIFMIAQGLAALALGNGEDPSDFFEAAIWTGTTADLIADTWPT